MTKRILSTASASGVCPAMLVPEGVSLNNTGVVLLNRRLEPAV